MTLPDSYETRIGVKHLIVAAVIFIIAVICLQPRIQNCHEWGDEGYFANGALRVLDGQVIYKDFQHNYPPGRCFSLAMLIGLFGHDLWVVRLFWCVMQAGAVALCYLLGLRLMAPFFAVLLSATVLFNNAPMNKSVELMITSLLVLVLFRVFERRTSFFKAGVFVALIGHFRHDTAVFGLLLLGIGIGFLHLKQRYARSKGKEIDNPLRPIRALLGCVAGFGIAFVPLAAYLLYHGALGTAIYDLAFSGFKANTAMNIPFPVLFENPGLKGIREGLNSLNVVFYIPFVLYGLGLIVTDRLIRKRGDTLLPWYVGIVTLLGILLFIQVLPRTDAGHLNKAYIPAHLLEMALVSLAFTSIVRHIKAGTFLKAAGALIAFLVVTAFPLKQLQFNMVFTHSILEERAKLQEMEKVDFPRGWLYANNPDAVRQDFEPMFPYAGKEGEYMVFYPAGALLNFICGLPNPLKYDLLRVGELLGNDPEVKRRILARLEETKPRFILIAHLHRNVEIHKLLMGFIEKHGYTLTGQEICKIYTRP